MATFKTTQIYGDLYVNNKVGIGTTSPLVKTHINGNTRIDANNSNAYNEGVAINCSTEGANYGGLTWHNTSYSGSFGASTIKWLQYYNYNPEGGVGAGGLNIIENNTNTRLHIATGGNVGIGTPFPQNILHVKNVNDVTAIGTGDGILIKNSSIIPHEVTIGIHNTYGSIVQSSENASTAFPLLLNPYGGNVGIGITNPASIFVASSGNANSNAGLFLGGTTCASILPFNAEIYLSAGTYYQGGNWFYYNQAGASLFNITETNGVKWHSGTGASYSNVASAVVLWDATGTWKSNIMSSTVSASAIIGNAYQLGSGSYNTKLVSYTISNSDDGKLVIVNSGSNVTVTLTNTNISPTFTCTFYQSGSGRILFTTSSTSVVMRNRSNFNSSAGQYAIANVIRVPNGDFILGGDLI